MLEILVVALLNLNGVSILEVKLSHGSIHFDLLSRIIQHASGQAAGIRSHAHQAPSFHSLIHYSSGKGLSVRQAALEWEGCCLVQLAALLSIGSGSSRIEQLNLTQDILSPISSKSLECA